MYWRLIAALHAVDTSEPPAELSGAELLASAIKQRWRTMRWRRSAIWARPFQDMRQLHDSEGRFLSLGSPLVRVWFSGCVVRAGADIESQGSLASRVKHPNRL